MLMHDRYIVTVVNVSVTRLINSITYKVFILAKNTTYNIIRIRSDKGLGTEK